MQSPGTSARRSLERGRTSMQGSPEGGGCMSDTAHSASTVTAIHQRLCSWLRDPMPPGAPDDEAVELARAEGVHLLLADRCGLPALIPEVSAAAVVDELQARELADVLSALSAERIDAVLLKGAGLARTHYARPELRPRSDTDFMIREDARQRASRVLERLGYQRAAEVDGELAVGQFHF